MRSLTVALCLLALPAAAGAADLSILPDQQVRGCIDLRPGGPRYRVNPQTLLATGGAPADGYWWRLSSGSAFPPGTAVLPSTGVFAGTGAPLEPGIHEFSMTVSDGFATATAPLTMVVETSTDGCPATPLQQWPQEVFGLPEARAGDAYGASLFARGGVPPYRWGEEAEVLEEGLRHVGLVLDRVRGVVRGTPLPVSAGRVLRFRVRLSDRSGATSPGTSGPVYMLTIRSEHAGH